MIEGAQPAEPPAAAPGDGQITAANVEEVLEKHGLHGPDYGLLPHTCALRDEFNTSHKTPVGNKIGIHIDPLHPGNPEFNYEEIFDRLDGEVDVPSGNAMEMENDSNRRVAYTMTAKLFSLVLDWLVGASWKGERDGRVLKSVGVRAVAMAWVISPDRFGGASLTTVAKNIGFKGHSAISPEAAEFSRRFGITNQFQRHCKDKDKIYEKPTSGN